MSYWPDPEPPNENAMIAFVVAGVGSFLFFMISVGYAVWSKLMQ